MKKHKILTILLIFLFTIALTSCDFDFGSLFPSSKEVPQSGVQPTGETSTTDDTSDPSQIKENPIEYSFDDDSLKKNGPMTRNCMPSIGEPKMLVVPIDLKQDGTATLEEKNKIDTAFNGTNEATGWRSVKTFYSESSYGKLKMDITVTNWYTPKMSADYYSANGTEGATTIFKDVMSELEKTMDFQDYDYDNDGFIDAVWLVYNASVDFTGKNEFYWAYVSSGATYTYDNKKIQQFAFAGMDFMKMNSTLYDRTNIKIDAHTYVHETGHLLGLDDYYDYDNAVGQSGGMYYMDMMDGNVGDHGMISKLILGWISPNVVSESGAYTVDQHVFSSTSDCLVIANHKLDSIYDEYFMIEFYDSAGLNSGVPIMAGAKGLRIVHVDAKQNYINGVLKSNGGKYTTAFKYDNSDTNYLFVNTLYAGSYPLESHLRKNNLFQLTGQQFGIDSYTNYYLHDGSKLFFSIKVNSIENGTITYTLTIK